MNCSLAHLVTIVALTTPTFADVSEGVAPRPPLGWNSFDSYGVYLHEQAAFANLEAFEEKLQPHGYEYFVVDAGWYGEFQLVPGTRYPAETHAREVALDEYGRYEPSQTYFPNGLQSLIERTHQAGLKFGVHLMRGIPRQAVELNLPILGTPYRAREIADQDSICEWNDQNYGVDMDHPGAQAYYDSVYQKLADWGVDLVKVDDIVPFPKELMAVYTAVERTQRSMVISLSPGGSANLKDMAYYLPAHMVRITSDIWDEPVAIERGFEAWQRWQGIGRADFWPDLDMIPFGQLCLMNRPEHQDALIDTRLAGKGTTRWSRFTPAQMRTFITQRALAASPLMVGGDLPTMDAYPLELLTNGDMLACNQNGQTATLVKVMDGIEMWSTAATDKTIRGWIGLFNRSSERRPVKVSKDFLELENYYLGNRQASHSMNQPFPRPFRLKDVWSDKQHLLQDEEITFTISPGDVLFLAYEEIGR